MTEARERVRCWMTSSSHCRKVRSLRTRSDPVVFRSVDLTTSWGVLCSLQPRYRSIVLRLFWAEIPGKDVDIYQLGAKISMVEGVSIGIRVEARPLF